MYDFSDFEAKKESIFTVLMSNSMYQCIIQWVIIGLLLAILVFSILIFVKLCKGIVAASPAGSAKMMDDRMYFCKSCGAQCSGSDLICPKCGARRV